jgi:hypothetical protein
MLFSHVKLPAPGELMQLVAYGVSGRGSFWCLLHSGLACKQGQGLWERVLGDLFIPLRPVTDPTVSCTFDQFVHVFGALVAGLKRGPAWTIANIGHVF